MRQVVTLFHYGSKVRILLTSFEIQVSGKETKNGKHNRRMRRKRKARRQGRKRNRVQGSSLIRFQTDSLKENQKDRLGRGRKGRRKGEGSPKRMGGSFPGYLRGIPRRPEWTRPKALRKVPGIGRKREQEVQHASGLLPYLRIGKRKPYQLQLIEAWVNETRRVGPDRQRLEDDRIQRHLKLGTVRGMKRRRGLPVRGQRTSTNGRTARRLNKQRGSKLR